MTDIYVAGAVAAFTIDLLVYPLDTIKTRYQSQDYAAGSGTKPLSPRGLYQGVGSVILATLPAAGLFFSTYENATATLSRTLPAPKPIVHSAASAVAEMASCMVIAPAEVIKQNAQMVRKRDSGGGSRDSSSLRALRQLGGLGAPRRLFTGYTALVARNLPFTALQFPMFEHIRARMWERRHRGGEASGPAGLLETGVISGVSAGGAGAVAAFITTPSDVVKTRMMLSAGQDKNRHGAWSVTKRVYTRDGVRGLFRGALLRSGWTLLGSGLYLGTYNVATVWLKQGKSDIADL
ncbi:solute carrier family 25 (mitochondrial S-adenosylmethionine transporter), member 26 [Geosmithia morbida]|uniref:Solute carrier family 25 (Mitochondrial S-adenosylmethionine transporter), member 26 n=1 Tax=Geosmithia morbida TaxID=1094350 RepID=A0A9P4YVT4_9HYPO|nr:solute carrier family 25 (mitochondrial S-adenosylmethionine transporter), member 26 [Geosmithia morbida]KAF4122950.1 solute carrier family 25 (mitochondrial S-adenosylmethionine transporter), member 26 [Geosmithia morbida]